MVNIPTAYNVIIRMPTLHKFKAVISPYFLQIQYNLDDENVRKLRGNQQIVRECYLVIIKLLMKQKGCPRETPSILRQTNPSMNHYHH